MAKMNSKKNTMIDGIGASEALDSTGERLMIEGLDITSLQEGTGVFNYEHKNDTPAQVVGKVLYAKKIFSAEDCETDRQKYYWKKVKCPYLYVKGELFDADGSDSAKEVVAALRYDAKQRAEDPKSKDVYGFSIEGSKLEKKGQEITHSIARKVTVTQAPANKSCFAEICPEQEESDDSLDLSFMKSERLEKTLTASQGNVAPSSTSGFQALVPENMDKTIKDSNFGKLFSKIHSFVKKKYPAKSPKEVDAIAKALVHRTIEKAEDSLAGKMDQPAEVEDDDLHPAEMDDSHDPHAHLMDNKNFAIQLEDALQAHEKNRFMGQSDPFYKLLADSDEKLVTHMNDLHDQDDQIQKALPKETPPKIITPPAKTKKEFWGQQAVKRSQNMKDFMENDLPKFKEIATNKKTGKISKSNADALRMRTKYRQKMLDTANLSASADDLSTPPPIHVGFSNEKLRKDGVATFDIQPDASCPGAHGRGCLGNCYFMKGQSFNLPDNEEKVLNNTAATARKDFADRMIQHLGDLKQRENIKHLRIHSGGDMYHQAYADDWAKIAQAHPDINFYIYTKSHHLDFGKHNKLPNFTVNHSQGSIYDHLLPKDAPKVEIAPNKHAFDYLVSLGFKDATSSDLAAANNKEGAPLVLMYHTGAKDAYNPKHMLSSKARELLADKFGEEEGFKVERKEESKPKAPPKPKKKLTREQIQRRMAKLQAQLESMGKAEGFDSKSSRVKKMLEEYADNTQEHPFDHNSRIHGFETADPKKPEFAVSDLKPHHDADTVHLSWLQAFNKGKGYGAKALKEITDLADKHGVKVSLTAGSGSMGAKTSPKKRLIGFYKRNGFIEHPRYAKGSGIMIRHPQSEKLGKSMGHDHIEDDHAIAEIFPPKPMKMAEKPFHNYNKKKHSKTGGLNDSYRKKYNRETGSKLKRPVTGKVKAGSEAAGRRKSFCARMSGVKGPTSKDGKLTPKGAALKRWKCGSVSKAEEQPKKVIPPRPEGKPASKPSMSQQKWYNMSYKDKKKHVQAQLQKEKEDKLIAEGKLKPREEREKEIQAKIQSEIADMVARKKAQKSEPLMKPFRSQAQRRFAYAHPEKFGGKKGIKEWESKTPKDIPEKLHKQFGAPILKSKK